MADDDVASDDERLKVAVVGAGPAGMYVADSLLSQDSVPVRVDIFDRLPTPFGLLRYGVAPDHTKMKTLQKTLQRTLDDDRVHFAGGVEIGKDVTVEQLRAGYHAVVYTFGASSDRRMGVPGEELPGSASATEFVNWYSGHPDVPADAFTLDAETAVVVGVGNVAVDVARVLLKSVDDLAHTDIPESVLDVLASSAIRNVHVLGRRGPVQAKFTSKELTELGEIPDVDVIVDPADVAIGPQSAEALQDAAKGIHNNLATLREWSLREPSGAYRRLYLHFWCRPVAITGEDRLEAITVERTRYDDDGSVSSAGEFFTIDTGLVLRSVGYMGIAIPGVPLDANGVVPNDHGRVLRNGVVSKGEYAAGWIGRGPVGVLGTNKHDARDVVGEILQDALTLVRRPLEGADVISELRGRGHAVVDKEGWERIDRAERAKGALRNRDREKIASYDELLAAAVQETDGVPDVGAQEVPKSASGSLRPKADH